jgi:hypothetical protein
VIVLDCYDPHNSETIPLLEFLGDEENRNDIDFLLEQITLEADMCYGRNETCKKYFRELYECRWLIDIIQDKNIISDLKSKFVRLLNTIYIDDAPHKMLKMTRAFKAYESANQYIEKISSRRSNYLTNENLEELIVYSREYIKAFAAQATGISSIKKYDMEFVKLLGYLVKFGLFIYRNNKYQSQDIDLIFSFL